MYWALRVNSAEHTGPGRWTSRTRLHADTVDDAQFHGAYALQITWNDGHRTGLFPFEALRRWNVSGPPR